MMRCVTFGGQEVVINPAHVRFVRPAINGTEIVLDCYTVLEPHPDGGTMPSPSEHVIGVKNPFHLVAAALGAREVGR